MWLKTHMQKPFTRSKMTRKSRVRQQKSSGSINPFSVKKRSSKKTRTGPNKKYNLEAVDHQFSSLHKDSLRQDSSSRKELSVSLSVKIVPGSSSAGMDEIVKRTENTDISDLSSTPCEL